MCGPNCVGVVNLHAQAATYSVALPSTLRRGHVGAVLQSGAVCLGIANSNRGLGFSTLISSGNEAVLDNADYIAYLADDPDTKVIIAFIEGFKSPDKFIWAAERARAAGKPLLVVKVGRSEVAQRATMAHTGSLAGADAVHDAVFRKHGVVRLDSLDELLETAELFLKAPPPAGRGVALLTLSGGQIGLIGDLMQGLDLHLPALSEAGVAALAQVLPPYSALANPLDAWGAGNFDETYPACMRILAAEPEVHLVAVARDTSPGIAEPEIRQSNVIVDAAAEVAAATGQTGARLQQHRQRHRADGEGAGGCRRPAAPPGDARQPEGDRGADSLCGSRAQRQPRPRRQPRGRRRARRPQTLARRPAGQPDRAGRQAAPGGLRHPRDA